MDAAIETPARPGRKRDHGRDPEILRATLDVLAEQGYDGMTIDEVAARCRAGKATLYRRWASKADLVLDALTQLKAPFDDLPDTGTLRGDLVALIRTPAGADGERKARILAGVVAMLSRNPELSDAARAALVEPRARATRALLERARDRGEVAQHADLDLLSSLVSALVAYRAVIERGPVTRDYLERVIDGVLLPAAGVRGRD